jgi:hypothetical protein
MRTPYIHQVKAMLRSGPDNVAGGQSANEASFWCNRSWVATEHHLTNLSIAHEQQAHGTQLMPLSASRSSPAGTY